MRNNGIDERDDFTFQLLPPVRAEINICAIFAGISPNGAPALTAAVPLLPLPLVDDDGGTNNDEASSDDDDDDVPVELLLDDVTGTVGEDMTVVDGDAEDDDDNGNGMTRGGAAGADNADGATNVCNAKLLASSSFDDDDCLLSLPLLPARVAVDDEVDEVTTRAGIGLISGFTTAGDDNCCCLLLFCCCCAAADD
jgi:hypothetical protein